MNRKTVIITETQPGQKLAAWGNLRKLCKKYGFTYSQVIRKKLPVTICDTTIHRVKYIE